MMKKLLERVFVRLSKKDLENLTMEVKETILSTDDLPANEKRFTSAQLWKIQQLKKPVSIRNRFSH
jgi:hypothetical protein